MIRQVQGPGKVHELESTVAALTARCAELEARLQMQVHFNGSNLAQQQRMTCRRKLRAQCPR